MIDQISSAVKALLDALPPEAVPVLERLAWAGLQLAQQNPAAALASLQAAERKLNATLAKQLVRKVKDA